MEEAHLRVKYYKVLKDGRAKDGGSFDYNPYIKSGGWLPEINDLKKCKKGYHLTTNPLEWLNEANQVFEVLLKKDVKVMPDSDNKFVVNTFKFKCLEETNTGISNTGLYNSGNKNSGDKNSGNKNSGYSNSGHSNSGDCNSGDKNSGYRNSGDRNSGDCNSGYDNSGYENSGHENSGHENSGNENSGDRNSGDRNSGHWNSGCWNACNCETGYFNTKQDDTIRVFNKPCLKHEWEKAIKPDFLYFNLTKWVNYTEEEKRSDKNKELIGGYLKKLDYKEAFKESFNQAEKQKISLLIKLPNFNYSVFEEISGITEKMIKEKLNLI